MHPMYVPATFEVRSLLTLPVPELIGGGRGGGLPLSKNWFGPWLCPRSLSPHPKKPYALPNGLFISVHSFSRDFRLEFCVGVANPQSLGRGGRRGSG